MRSLGVPPATAGLLAWRGAARAVWRRSERCGRTSVTCPHDTLVVLADLVWVGIAQLGEEIGQGLRIELKLPLQGAIGHAAPLAQQRHRLIDDRDKVHPCPPYSVFGSVLMGSASYHK